MGLASELNLIKWENSVQRLRLNQIKIFVPESFSTISLQCFDTVGWVTGRHPACKIVGVGLLVVTTLHVLQLQLSPPPLSSLAPVKSRMETFQYQLSQVHLEKGPLKWRE